MFRVISPLFRWAGAIVPLLVVVLAASCMSGSAQSTDVGAHVPKVAPRTMVLAGWQDAFRACCTTGEGAVAFNKIKSDYDRHHVDFTFPDETHTTAESVRATVARIPLGRAGKPEDVAPAAVFLASESDGFITGVRLDINGGVYAA